MPESHATNLLYPDTYLPATQEPRRSGVARHCPLLYPLYLTYSSQETRDEEGLPDTNVTSNTCNRSTNTNTNTNTNTHTTQQQP